MTGGDTVVDTAADAATVLLDNDPPRCLTRGRPVSPMG